MLTSTGLCRSRIFNQLPRAHRRNVSHLTLNSHHSSYFGGRLANVRFAGRSSHKKAGPAFTLEPETVQYNIDIWSSQQTLRRKWKGRNWRVVELPFDSAPRMMQRVIPELYTELPVMASPSTGDHSNIRNKTFAQEDLQGALFNTGAGENVLPTNVKRGKSSVTLDSFFSG